MTKKELVEWLIVTGAILFCLALALMMVLFGNHAAAAVFQ